MLKLLERYNARARKLELPRDRITPGLGRSLVSIVENDAQLRMELHYGLADQAVAGKILSVACHAGKRHIKPSQPQYAELCDLVLRMESPEVYRTATSHAADGGYRIGQDSVKKIIDAAKKGHFAYLFLQNEVSLPVRRMTKHVSLDLIFSKKL